MSKLIDLTGKKFGRLTVLKIDKKVRRSYYWLCKCDCGTLKSIKGSHLKDGKIVSCGCYQKELATILGTKHGMSKHKLSKVFDTMKDRCYNPNNKSYKNYGERGIKICEEWLNDNKKFFEWSLNNGYEEGLSIDRINVNDNYCPENCRWVNQSQQMRNTRINVYITYKGEKHTLIEWSEILNISYNALQYRRKKKWATEKMFTTPEKPNSHFLTFNNCTHTINEWARILDIKRETIKTRLEAGWSVEKTLSTPVRHHL